MATVHEFPPVGIVSALLRVDRPVRRSQYALTGKRAVSSAGPARRVVNLDVSALAKDRAGAGYLAGLWEYLDGGVDLVSLTLPPQNWHYDKCVLRSAVGNEVVGWTSAGADLGWTSGGSALRWFTSTVRTASSVTTAQYPHMVNVTGLPKNTVVARPGDIVRVFAPDDDEGVTARVVDICRTNGSGVVNVPLAETVPDGVISFAEEETAIFEVIDYNPQPQPVGQNWIINIALREVFESELDTITTVNTWRA